MSNAEFREHQPHYKEEKVEPRDEALFALSGALALIQFEDPITCQTPRNLSFKEQKIVTGLYRDIERIDFDKNNNTYLQESWVYPYPGASHIFPDGVGLNEVFEHYESEVLKDQGEDEDFGKMIIWSEIISILKENCRRYTDLFESESDLNLRIRYEAEIIAGQGEVTEEILEDASRRITEKVIFYPDRYRSTEIRRRRQRMLEMIPEDAGDSTIPKSVFERANPFTKEGLGAMMLTLIPVNAATVYGADRTDAFIVGGSVAAALTFTGRMRRKNGDIISDKSRLDTTSEKVVDISRSVVLPVSANYAASIFDPSIIPSDKLVDLIQLAGAVAYTFVLPRAFRMAQGPLTDKIGENLEERGKELFSDYEPFVIDPTKSPTEIARSVSRDAWDLLLDLHPILIGVKPGVRNLLRGDQRYLDTVNELIHGLLKQGNSQQSNISVEDRAFLQYSSLYKTLEYIRKYEDEYVKKRANNRLKKARNTILDTLFVLDPLVVTSINRHLGSTGRTDLLEENRNVGETVMAHMPNFTSPGGLVDIMTDQIYANTIDNCDYDQLVNYLSTVSFRDNASRGVARLSGRKAGGLTRIILRRPQRPRQ